MKLYGGCSSPDEHRKRPCEDEERNSAKKSCFFSKLLFFLCCEVPVERMKEAFSADYRLEQPSRTNEATEERPLWAYCHKHVVELLNPCKYDELERSTTFLEVLVPFSLQYHMVIRNLCFLHPVLHPVLHPEINFWYEF